MSERSVAIDGGKPHAGSDNGSSGRGSRSSYSGWVYHIGVSSIGHQYCRLRYLTLKDKYIAMYKRDPHDDHGIVRSLALYLSLLN